MDAPGPTDAPPRPDMLTLGDPLAGLLEGPRARGALLIRACFDPSWAVRVEDRAPLTVMLMVRGEGLVLPDEGEGVRLRAGDLAIARGPAPYTCADAPGTRPQALILPGGRCAYPDGRLLNGSIPCSSQGIPAFRPGGNAILGPEARSAGISALRRDGQAGRFWFSM